VVYGQEARLEVRTETDDLASSYQWFKNGRKLFGRTRKTLVIASTVESDEGSYTCQILTPEGTVMSHPATIAVVSVPPKALQPQPQPQPFRPAETKSRTFGPPREQYHDSRPSTGGVGAVYGLRGRGVDNDNSDQERSLLYGAAIPSPAPPKAVGAIQITEQPQSQAVPLGTPVTLTCRASLSGSAVSPEDLTFVWYMNGLSLLEHTSPEYRIASLTEEDEGMYSCEVSSLNQTVMSQMATVSVSK
jgi:hypothetical protein